MTSYAASDTTANRLAVAIASARAGQSVRRAAASAEIPLATLYLWVQRSRAGCAPAWICEQWNDAVAQQQGRGRSKPVCVISHAITLVEGGMTPDMAAAACSIAPTTIRRWVRRSRAGDAPSSLAERWDAILAARRSPAVGEECDYCGDICEAANSCAVEAAVDDVAFTLYFCGVECRDAFTKEQ